MKIHQSVALLWNFTASKLQVMIGLSHPFKIRDHSLLGTNIKKEKIKVEALRSMTGLVLVSNWGWETPSGWATTERERLRRTGCCYYVGLQCY